MLGVILERFLQNILYHSCYTSVILLPQENRPVGYSMLRLMATDADAEPNGAPFTWEVINQGPDNRAFTLDQDGSLRLATNKLNHLVGLHQLNLLFWLK